MDRVVLLGDPRGSVVAPNSNSCCCSDENVAPSRVADHPARDSDADHLRVCRDERCPSMRALLQRGGLNHWRVSGGIDGRLGKCVIQARGDRGMCHSQSRKNDENRFHRTRTQSPNSVIEQRAGRSLSHERLRCFDLSCEWQRIYDLSCKW